MLVVEKKTYVNLVKVEKFLKIIKLHQCPAMFSAWSLLKAHKIRCSYSDEAKKRRIVIECQRSHVFIVEERSIQLSSIFGFFMKSFIFDVNKWFDFVLHMFLFFYAERSWRIEFFYQVLNFIFFTFTNCFSFVVYCLTCWATVTQIWGTFCIAGCFIRPGIAIRDTIA